MKYPAMKRESRERKLSHSVNLSAGDFLPEGNQIKTRARVIPNSTPRWLSGVRVPYRPVTK
jgi:hypothetical protein